MYSYSIVNWNQPKIDLTSKWDVVTWMVTSVAIWSPQRGQVCISMGISQTRHVLNTAINSWCDYVPLNLHLWALQVGCTHVIFPPRITFHRARLIKRVQSQKFGSKPNSLAQNPPSVPQHPPLSAWLSWICKWIDIENVRCRSTRAQCPISPTSLLKTWVRGEGGYVIQARWVIRIIINYPMSYGTM